jgi:SNF2 family DNA or RNA helicase
MNMEVCPHTLKVLIEPSNEEEKNLCRRLRMVHVGGKAWQGFLTNRKLRWHFNLTEGREALSKSYEAIETGRPATGTRYVFRPHGAASDLRIYQKLFAYISDHLPRYMGCFDIGTGKTITALEVIARKNLEYPELQWVVVTPSAVITSWLADAAAHYPHLKIATLKRGQKRTDYARVLEGWGITPTGRKNDLEQQIWTTAEVMVINPEAMQSQRFYNWSRYQGLIIDESDMLTDPKSKTSEYLQKLGMRMDYVYQFSGTPFPNSTFEAWLQLYLVDPAILGTSYSDFKREFGVEDTEVAKIKVYQAMKQARNRGKSFAQVKKTLHRYRKIPFIAGPNTSDHIMEKVKPWAISVEKREVLKDLPPLTTITREVELSSAEKKFHDRIDKVLEELGGKGGGNLMRYRTLASGFLYLRDPETNERLDEVKVMDPDHEHSKVKEMRRIKEQFGDNQVVIWVEFDHEVNMLLPILGGRRKTAVVMGSKRTKDKDGELLAFREGRAQYVICHPRAVSKGNNDLKVASRMVFFSPSFSSGNWDQCVGRIERGGQKHPMTVIRLSTQGTIEPYMWQAVDRKMKLIDFIREVLK